MTGATSRACGMDFGSGQDKTMLTVIKSGPDGIRIIGQVELGRIDETDTWLHVYDPEGKHVLAMAKPAPPRT
jgi:hypothetical protein